MKTLINTGNPEFMRNIWQEMTTGRIVAMPIILAMIFFAVFSLNNTAEGSREAARIISILIFMLLGIIYGTKLATESIIGELNDRTWDNQRMTLISPTSMAIGKLFGSTSFAWYGSILALIMFTITSFYSNDIWMNLRFGIWMILCTILTHELALITSLMGLRKNRDRVKISWFFYYVVAVGISYYIQGMVYLIFFTSNLSTLRDKLFSVSWYFINFNIIDMLILSTAVFIVYSFVGLKNLIRSEFHVRNKSYTWVFFILFIIFYFFGFGISFNLSGFGETIFGSLKNFGILLNIHIGMLISMLMLEGLVYFLIFNEKNNALILNKTVNLIRQKRFREMNYEAPLWLTTLIITAVFTILFQIESFIFFSFEGDLINSAIKDNLNILLPVCMFFYLLRDVLILLFFNLNQTFKKPEIATLMTLFLLYYIMPVITLFTGGIYANTYFSPFGTGWLSIVSIGIQLVVIFLLFLNTYRKKILKFSY